MGIENDVCDFAVPGIRKWGNVICLISLAVGLSCLCSCRKSCESMSYLHEETNALYYWKTALDPGSADYAFLRRHNVGRIYLRMFDVVAERQDTHYWQSELIVPNASLKVSDEAYRNLEDSLAAVAVTPVVYVTLDALKRAKGQEGSLAMNIVKRVRNMCSYNSIPNVEGLQLDCDWTESTESSFFQLCDSVRIAAASFGLAWQLSSTIRLHQLACQAPPVDYGVLMVYNTGNFKDPDAENSILSLGDVEPYLKHLEDYDLHLDVAYPAYTWQLLFRNRQFAGLLRDVDVTDSTRFALGGPKRYMAREDVPQSNNIIRKGDIVRIESSSPDEILAVKAAIEERLGERPHSNIIYHFDLNNLLKYSSDEIDNIFATAIN